MELGIEDFIEERLGEKLNRLMNFLRRDSREGIKCLTNCMKELKNATRGFIQLWKDGNNGEI